MNADTRARLRAIATDSLNDQAEELNYAVGLLRRVYPDLSLHHVRAGRFEARIATREGERRVFHAATWPVLLTRVAKVALA